MAFKLVVSDTITTRVKGVYTDADGSEKTFDFKLVQDRVSNEVLEKATQDNTETAAAFIKRITKGWRDQRLVLEEDGKTPAEFSADALDALLSISGMPGQCWLAYRNQVIARAKN